MSIRIRKNTWRYVLASIALIGTSALHPGEALSEHWYGAQNECGCRGRGHDGRLVVCRRVYVQKRFIGCWLLVVKSAIEVEFICLQASVGDAYFFEECMGMVRTERCPKEELC
jgi:hypothetical protein